MGGAHSHTKIYRYSRTDTICWVISHTPHTKDKELCFVFTQHRFFVCGQNRMRGGGGQSLAPSAI